jgi:hypothetical protein
MVIPLTTITAFSISPWWCPGSFIGHAPCCRCTGLTHGNRIVQFGISDDPVFTLPNTSPGFPILSHEDVKSDLWALLWLAPLIFPLLAIFQTFGPDHPRLTFLSYDNLFPLGRLG